MPGDSRRPADERQIENRGIGTRDGSGSLALCDKAAGDACVEGASAQAKGRGSAWLLGKGVLCATLVSRVQRTHHSQWEVQQRGVR